MMIAFWGAIIVLLVLLVRWFGGASTPNPPSSASASRRSPLEILQERFAKGEIDKEDYEERRKLLSD
ncbi:SHOCT domain-containing protein [Aquibaculum sediminis]|uniref:SHOCT domain-containing protein n=1 Tax=Aquibaculum sediminis TaxID=3231907 RepID=UPI003456B0C6